MQPFLGSDEQKLEDIDVTLHQTDWEVTGSYEYRIAENGNCRPHGVVYGTPHFMPGKLVKIVIPKIKSDTSNQDSNQNLYCQICEEQEDGTWSWIGVSKNTCHNNSMEDKVYYFDGLQLDGQKRICVMLDKNAWYHVDNDRNSYHAFSVNYANKTSNDTSYMSNGNDGGTQDIVGVGEMYFSYSGKYVNIIQHPDNRAGCNGIVIGSGDLKAGKIKSIKFYGRDSGSWGTSTNVYMVVCEYNGSTWDWVDTSTNYHDNLNTNDMTFLFDNLNISGSYKIGISLVSDRNNHVNDYYNSNIGFGVATGYRTADMDPETGAANGANIQTWCPKVDIWYEDGGYKLYEATVESRLIKENSQIDFGLPVPTTRDNATNVSKCNIIVTDVQNGSLKLQAYTNKTPAGSMEVNLKLRSK